ncbi:MAG: DNA polymerase III subunit delta' [Nitrospinae bacterium]|nr:DNA polymerase III subunit delta' [Nitrospinota bacterium]
MSFKDILGQDRAKRILTNSLLRGAVSHAYLFSGPEGVGKRLTAFTFAKALNCSPLETHGDKSPLETHRDKPNREGDSCDRCLSCKKIHALNHPDLNFIEPDDESIKIEAVRKLQSRISLKPYEGKKKVVIIAGAECMTDEAVNAFLKTLEEPPGETVIMLITANQHSLLPTVVSRCQIIKFNALAGDHIKEILIKDYRFNERDASILSSISKGRLGRAVTMDYKAVCKERDEALKLIISSAKGDMEYIFTDSKRLAKKEDLPDFLDIVADLLRDAAAMRGADTDDCIINKDMKEKLREFSDGLHLPFIINMFDAVQKTKFLLKRNANQQLSIETMMLGMGGD